MLSQETRLTVVRAVLAGACALVLCAPTLAQESGWWGRARAVMSGLPGQGALTQREAEQGLKEGLTAAAAAAARRLGRENGYFGDAALKIPLPRSLAQMQTRLAAFGMDGPLKELELNINRAAEASAPEIERLVVKAVSSMTIDDALGVLRGGDNAATVYLRQRTEADIEKLLRPQMETALAATGAFAAVDKIGASMPIRGLTGDLKSDLVDYALEKTLDGAFLALGDEERALRRDPARWTSAILRRVYGAS